MNRLVKVAVSLFAAVLAMVIVVFALAWFEGSTIWWPAEEFSTSLWQSAPREQRYRQFKSLQRKHNLVGMTRTEVETLLGRADSVAPDGRYLTYDLREGKGDRLSFNSVYFMRLWVDGGGRIQDVVIDAD